MGGPPETLPALASEVLEAYGAQRWAAADRLMVIVSAGGPMLSTRLQAAAVRCRTAFLPSSGPPKVVFDPYPEAGSMGVLADGEVRVVAFDGTVVASQEVGPPASALRWGDLDVLAFAGTTVWSWVGLPLLLDDGRLGVRELPSEAGQGRLQVDVPTGWPVDSARHVLHVDDTGRVRRHEETLDVLGRRLAVRSDLSGHCEFEGVLVATHRRTRGPFGARLLWADVVAAHLIPGRPNPSTGA